MFSGGSGRIAARFDPTDPDEPIVVALFTLASAVGGVVVGDEGEVYPDPR